MYSGLQLQEPPATSISKIVIRSLVTSDSQDACTLRCQLRVTRDSGWRHAKENRFPDSPRRGSLKRIKALGGCSTLTVNKIFNCGQAGKQHEAVADPLACCLMMSKSSRGARTGALGQVPVLLHPSTTLLEGFCLLQLPEGKQSLVGYYCSS
jgi:hypothetical protein